MEEPDRVIPDSVSDNVDAVLAVERQAQAGGSSLARVAHGLGSFVGSVTFAALHLAVFAIWFLLNSGLFRRTVFDPYPFAFLGTVVSCEAVMLATFVLIKQNREGERAEKRSHLDLQVNLLAEREITKVLQMLHGMAERSGHGGQPDDELDELMEHTPVKDLAEHLDERHSDRNRP